MSEPACITPGNGTEYDDCPCGDPRCPACPPRIAAYKKEQDRLAEQKTRLGVAENFSVAQARSALAGLVDGELHDSNCWFRRAPGSPSLHTCDCSQAKKVRLLLAIYDLFPDR